MTTAIPRVLSEVRDAVGILTLNRPEAINALDIGMVRDLARTLASWSDDPGVAVVVLTGAGERGFCAGADVRLVRDQLLTGRTAEATAFFREEYALNARIAAFPKPVVTLADGVTMGGGIGLASHASVRVVTERSRLAMPETRIGFTPDVGASFLLARAPGRSGEYLAVTGAVMSAADAIHAGFADHLVTSERVGGLTEAIVADAGRTGAAEIAASFARPPGDSALAEQQERLDDVFAADGLADVARRLTASGRGDELAGLSPLSMAIALASVRRARGLAGVREALAHEYALVDWFLTTGGDVVEGVRAQLVEKDRAPRWGVPRIDDVPLDAVTAALTHPPDSPLWS